MNILITSASNKVWLIQAFKKALMRNGGGNVFAADIDTRKIALYFADKHIIVPKSDNKSFIPDLISYRSDSKQAEMLENDLGGVSGIYFRF